MEALTDHRLETQVDLDGNVWYRYRDLMLYRFELQGDGHGYMWSINRIMYRSVIQRVGNGPLWFINIAETRRKKFDVEEDENGIFRFINLEELL